MIESPTPDPAALAAALVQAQQFLEREGYRRCDIAACNCGSWHREHRRRACMCDEPDPVMQADAKFYCHRCSFETGARPNALEPENSLAELQHLRSEVARLSDEKERAQEFSQGLLDATVEQSHAQLTSLQSTLSSLRGLVEKWRSQSAAYRAEHVQADIRRETGIAGVALGQSETFTLCADDLTALLPPVQPKET